MACIASWALALFTWPFHSDRAPKPWYSKIPLMIVDSALRLLLDRPWGLFRRWNKEGAAARQANCAPRS
jgi:hypothetical protein